MRNNSGCLLLLALIVALIVATAIIAAQVNPQISAARRRSQTTIADAAPIMTMTPAAPAPKKRTSRAAITASADSLSTSAFVSTLAALAFRRRAFAALIWGLTWAAMMAVATISATISAPSSRQPELLRIGSAPFPDDFSPDLVSLPAYDLGAQIVSDFDRTRPEGQTGCPVWTFQQQPALDACPAFAVFRFPEQTCAATATVLSTVHATAPRLVKVTVVEVAGSSFDVAGQIEMRQRAARPFVQHVHFDDGDRDVETFDLTW